MVIFAFSVSANENSTNSEYDHQKYFWESEKVAKVWNKENMLNTIFVAFSTIALLLILIFLLYVISRRESNLKRLWI